MIVHKLLPDGGFVCGDTETRETRYAYPTSPHAKQARKQPDAVALEMVKQANSETWIPASIRDPSNARNWASLA